MFFFFFKSYDIDTTSIDVYSVSSYSWWKRKPSKNELIDAASKILYSWFVQSIAIYLVSLNDATEK
jgi:hypothetical protein